MNPIEILEKLKQLLKTLNQLWENDEKLLETFFREIRETLNARNAFLAFVDQERTSRNIKFIEKEPDFFSRTVIFKTIENDCTTFIPDTASYAQKTESMGLIGLRTVLCTPFHCSDAIAGAFYVDRNMNKGPFSDEECRMVEIVCEQLAYIVRNSRLHRERLEERLMGPIWKEQIRWGLVGRSRQMQAIFDQIKALGDQDNSTVLIYGETGTGKEMIARALHYSSSRLKGPFLAVDCAAIPATLLESELFGYEAGAFSGAQKRKIGRFEVAQGGTLLLDEMSEIPLEIQVKLLRVLQEREFVRLGGTRKIQLNVRLLSASNQDPREAIRQGKIRLDFYQRLAVHFVQVPPLRERPDDILLLGQYFVMQKNGFLKKFTPKAESKLVSYDWPGNVRELENTIERAVFMAKDRQQIDAEDVQVYYLPQPTPKEGLYGPRVNEFLESPKAKQFIEQIVQETMNRNSQPKIHDLETFLIEKLKKGGRFSSQELQDGSGYERRSVQKALKKLIRDDRIKSSGVGKSTCYEWKQ